MMHGQKNIKIIMSVSDGIKYLNLKKKLNIQGFP